MANACDKKGGERDIFKKKIIAENSSKGVPDQYGVL